MGFDFDAFMSAKLKERTAKVPITNPLLKKYFKKLKKGEKAVWIVRGLDATEMAVVKEAEDRNRNLKAVIEKLLSLNADEKAEAIKEAIGITDKVPIEHARRLELLCIGSVDPEIKSKNQAVKVARFSNEFFELTNKILELTGMGPELGE